MNLIVGTLVEVDHKFNPDNLIGLVYETYPDIDYFGGSGVSVILEDGTDLGCFCLNDQIQHLTKIKNTKLVYEFETQIKLYQDYNKGLFRFV